jgi:hypothetical protein
MVDERCVKCFLNTYKRLFQKYNISEQQQRAFLAFFNHITDFQQTKLAPEIQRSLSKTFCRIVGVDDPFCEEKEESNRIALDLYNVWKAKVIDSRTPFDLALRLAIAGNIMDYGASNDFDVTNTLDRVLNCDFAIDSSNELKKRLAKAQNVLYLADNAGEIVFDRIFVETIMHSNLVYAVKGGPILNDVTIDDSIQVGMHYAADVISNGYDAPSTILSKCSDDFLKIYRSADLIISKGQGNLEGLLSENDSRIFFLLMVKCDLIAELLKVQKGSFVVYNYCKESF